MEKKFEEALEKVLDRIDDRIDDVPSVEGYSRAVESLSRAYLSYMTGILECGFSFGNNQFPESEDS